MAYLFLPIITSHHKMIMVPWVEEHSDHDWEEVVSCSEASRPATHCDGWGLRAGGKGASLHLLLYAKQTIIIILLYLNLSLSLYDFSILVKPPSSSCNFWADNSSIYEQGWIWYISKSINKSSSKLNASYAFHTNVRSAPLTPDVPLFIFKLTTTTTIGIWLNFLTMNKYWMPKIGQHDLLCASCIVLPLAWIGVEWGNVFLWTELFKDDIYFEPNFLGIQGKEKVDPTLE